MLPFLRFNRLAKVPLAVAGLSVGLMAPVLTVHAVSEDDDTSGWYRNFRVGGMVALGIKGRFGVNGTLPTSGSPGATNVAGVDHVFDDGYVKVDQTGNAGGRTADWGYEQSSQLTGDTLLFHSTTSLTAAGSHQAEDAPYVGLDVAYGGKIANWGMTRIGWEAGFAWLPISISDSQPLAASFQRTEYSVKTMNPGETLVLPQAPYHGGPSGTGPLILDSVAAGNSETVSGQITGSRSIDVTLYNLRLGPTFYSDLGSRFGVSFGGGFALGVLDGQYRYNETYLFPNAASAFNSGTANKLELQYGWYANATFFYHTGEDADIYLGFQYMPLGNAQFGIPGRDAELMLNGGLYFMAGVHWPF